MACNFLLHRYIYGAIRTAIAWQNVRVVDLNNTFPGIKKGTFKYNIRKR